MNCRSMEKYDELKEASALIAAREARSGMVVGLGSGSTVHLVLRELSRLMSENRLEIIGIPTSKETERIARKFGIPISTLAENLTIDLTIDGADEVDEKLDLIKGRGGALVREKIIANASKKLSIVADFSKCVKKLGTKTPLPIEIVPFGWEVTKTALDRLCLRSTLRTNGDGFFISDNGNYILDCQFGEIGSPKKLEAKLNNLPGVVENGLFINRVDQFIVGTPDGVQIHERSS